MIDEQMMDEQSTAGVSRRSVLTKAAAAGTVAWVAPMIAASPAAAATVSAISGACSGEVKTLYIKYNVDKANAEANGHAANWAQVSGANGNDCLAAAKAADTDRASNAEADCFLAAFRNDATVFVDYEPLPSGEKGLEVTITLPDYCTTDELVSSAKQGNTSPPQPQPLCVGGDDGRNGQSVTWLQNNGEPHAISHVELAIRCCVTDLCLD